MSGVSLDKFQQVQSTENVVIGEDKKEVAKQERGDLFGKFVNWITRSEAQKTSNNEVTKAFFDSLEKTYGKEVKDWATEGYESRLTEGKPLSGYRIQQILERARVGQEGLPEDQAMIVKERLFQQKAPEFVSEALERFNIPDDKRKDWEQTLVAMLPEAPQLSNAFDPLNYDGEFRTLVNNFLNTHEVALQNIEALEAKRQDVDRPIEPFAFPAGKNNNYRQMFLERFVGKTNDIDEYFNETVLPGARTNFTRAFGEVAPETMQNHDDVRELKDKVNNGTYQLYPLNGGEFVFIQRIDCGVRLLQEEEHRDEKFHVSVRPEDMAKAFEALSPILTEEDCPIQMWKAFDVGAGQRAIDELSPWQNELLKAKKDDPENFTPDQQKALDKLNDEIDRAQRLRDSCQITIYLDPDGDVEDKRVSKLLGDIERTLAGLGIEPTGTPESDERVGQFVSFRVGQITYRPGDEGYEEALGRAVAKVYGDPVTERIDPESEDYEQNHKVKFRDNPTYLAQAGVVVAVEVSRLSKELGNVGDDREGFDTIAGEVLRLGQRIGAMNVPDEAKRELEGTYNLLKLQLDEEIRRQAGVSNGTNELIWNAPVDERSQGFIDEIRTSTLDDVAKVRLEQLVSLTSKLMATASSLDTLVEDRLRMAGELESLHLELLGVLGSERDNVDGDGRRLLHGVRELPFKPDLGNIGEMFQQHDGSNIPDDAGRVSEMFGSLGVALESLDRGLPLIDDEREELDQLVEDLDNFLEFIGPRPGFEAPVNHLSNEIGRLRQAIVDQLGAKE